MDNHLLRFNKKARYCLVDIESFNLFLSLDYNRPWQIGILNAIGDDETESHDIIIKWPEHKYIKCSEEAARINHYSDAKVNESGIAPKDAAKILYDNLKNCDYIVGQNLLGFDIYLIKDFLAMFGYDWKFILPKIIDTKPIVSGLKQGIIFDAKADTSFIEYQYKLINTPAKGIKTSLSVVAKEYGIEFDESKLHDAIYDLRVTLALWNKLKHQIEI